MNGSLDALLEFNPSASTEDLAHALSTYIESSISEVLESIPLPPARIPSPADAMLRKLVDKRRGKSSRRLREDASERESFVAELYRIRRDLDGHAENGTVPSFFGGPRDGCGTLTELPGEHTAGDSSNGGMTVGGDGLDRTRLGPAHRFRRDSGNLAPLEMPAKVRFSLASQVQGLVASDTIFERVVRATEVSLRAFALGSEASMKLSFTMGRDPEYPDWKRYVIRISTSLDFDARIRLWSEMDAWIRKDLSQLSGATPEESARIKDIAGNLFLDMELV